MKRLHARNHSLRRRSLFSRWVIPVKRRYGLITPRPRPGIRTQLPKAFRSAYYSKPTADLVALGFSGKQITEIAVFSAKAGKWSRQALSEPVKGQFGPTVGTHLALYLSGRHAYAFSSSTGRWSHQALSEAADVRFGGNPLVADDFAVYTDYVDGRHVYGFSALTGTWETLEVEEGTSSRAEKGPSGTALVVGGSRLYSFDAKTGHFQEVPSKED